MAPQVDYVAECSGINLYSEQSLHSQLKTYLAAPGDRLEARVEGKVVDLVRSSGELVEVQTGGFSALGRTLDALRDEHRVRVVLPIAAERRIVRVDGHGQVISVRRSPKRGNPLDIFDRLVSLPSLLTHPNLTLEVLLLREDHVRAPSPTRSPRRRRTSDPGERRLVDVLERVELAGPEDLIGLLPELPTEPFTTRDLAASVPCRLLLAQRIVYCLRAAGVLEPAGKRGRAPLHRLLVTDH